MDEAINEGDHLAEGAEIFPCEECGAKLQFDPGKASLTCRYCGHENAIAGSDEVIEEYDYLAQLEELEEHDGQDEITAIKCQSCAAEFERPPNLTALSCPYCDRDIVLESQTKRLIKPASLLPFAIEEKAARQKFKDWLNSLWWAPNELKKIARSDSRLNGIYMPHWTYDCLATSRYAGQRGDDYWVSVPHTVRDANGNTRTETRRERRTRWRSVSGRVKDTFDDVVVSGSRTIPAKYREALEPWDLENLEPYQDSYLSGFKSENYQIGMAAGFQKATGIMEVKIRRHVKRDIGGDHQRISSLSVKHDDITYKHILLPVWLSFYHYRGKLFHFFINARTGEVLGERPYSVWKIASAIFLALIVVGLIILLLNA